MAKQTVNLGTSANKGDGDPLRTAFEKINENFTEVYSDVKQLNSINFGGGTLTSDIVGDVYAHDSTMLVDANGGEIVGPLASSSWTNLNNISIESSTGDIDVTATGTLTLDNQSGTDYITVANTGVLIYSDATVAIRSAGTDIEIGFDTASGDVQMGHNSSQVVVNGTLDAKRFAKIETPSYTTATRDGLVVNNGTIIHNTTTLALEAYVDGAWVKLSQQDLGDFTDNGGLIPTDVSDLTDTTVLIKSDVSQLNDVTNRIPTDIGDLLAGGSTGEVVTRTAVGYGWTSPVIYALDLDDLTDVSLSGGSSSGDALVYDGANYAPAAVIDKATLKSTVAASADFADFQTRIAAL